MKEIRMPVKVEYIITQLIGKGYEAYAVGGCIRDSILGKEPEDWDITTSASPSQIKEIFHRTVDTGILHGTVTVLIEKESFEVTTFRIDGEYEDNRHPKSVVFTSDLIEDLKRRDFTINAMAYNYETGIVDEFHGIKDLENKIIRCVGNAKERFTEDALRILRAIRFSAQLDFEIEENTKEAIVELTPNLIHISKERIQIELTKLLTSKHPEHIREVFETGMIDLILPQISTGDITVLDHSIGMLKQVKEDAILRWTVFLNDTKGETKNILRSLKFDNKTTDYVDRLVKWFYSPLSDNKESLRKSIYQIGEDIFPLLLIVKEADIKTKSKAERIRLLKEHIKIEESYKEILKKGDCLSLKDLAVDGEDLIAMGIAPGKEIGKGLKDLLELVFIDPKANKKEYLLKYIEKKEKP
ncbi:MAG: CCA tRNA nucleotidyltransferase [Clostridiales bacterium]|nr:CCA tRNA nucleotidyltransferase [Clostridiales bacterium]